MVIRSLRIQNMRRHIDSCFEFGSGANVLVGPNASGKTTVLEAILLAAGSRLPNGQRLASALRHEAEWLRVDMQVGNRHRIVKYEPQKSATRSFEINDTVFKRLHHEQIIPVVWFDPEELRLLRGSPARRRDYMDRLLVQVDPQYDTSLRQMQRALLQRNALLKQPATSADQFFVWNVRFAEHSAYIYAARERLITTLASKLQDMYARLARSRRLLHPTHQSLKTSNYTQSLMTQLESRLKVDRLRGFTSVGPHRDDMLILDGRQQPFGQTASRGEVRTLVLALKVIEVELLKEVFKMRPILLFDDVFSELDGARRQAFVDHLQDSQAIITTTDADIVQKNFASSARIVPLDTDLQPT